MYPNEHGLQEHSCDITRSEVKHWDNMSHQFPNKHVESMPAKLHVIIKGKGVNSNHVLF